MTIPPLLMGHPLANKENASYALLTMSRIRKFEEAVEDLAPALQPANPAAVRSI